MSISAGHMAEGASPSVGTAIDTNPIGFGTFAIPAPAEESLILGSAQELPTTASVD